MDSFHDSSAEIFDEKAHKQSPGHPPSRSGRLAFSFFLIALCLTVLALLNWATRVTPQELYHRVWQQTAEEIYDRTKLSDWAKWEHKFDKQIKTRHDAIKFANTMLETMLKDKYSRLYDLPPYVNLAMGEYISSGIELAWKLDAEWRPVHDCNGRSLASSTADGYALIAHVYPDSPAAQAGLKPGNAVLSIDGRSTLGQDVRILDSWLESPWNEPVMLIVRTDTGERVVTLERQRVFKPPVVSRILSGNIGYISLDNFVDWRNVKAVLKALDTLQACRALVLDLRNNPGGKVNVAYGMTSLFLEEGLVWVLRERMAGGAYETTWAYLKGHGSEFVRQQDGAGPVTTKIEQRLPNLLRKRPMVILVNGQTASAAEMFTGALKDNGKAIVVGTRTQGKGVGYHSEIMPLNTMLTVVSLQYCTPSGHWPGDGISEHSPGLAVDVLVPPAAGLEIGSQNDNQLAAACLVLAGQLALSPNPQVQGMP